MNSTVVLILLVTLVGYISCDCKHGWTANTHSCYLYLHEAYNFFEAKTACDIVEGYLVEIDSAKENAFVESFARQNGATNIWMGLEDFVVEREYRWTHSYAQPEYFNWVSSDPNNWRAQDCCAMDVKSAGWYDISCETKYSFVCEAQAFETEVIG